LALLNLSIYKKGGGQKEVAMRLINLTPHDIVMPDIIIAASGKVARVVATSEVVAEYGDGIQVVKTSFGDIEGLPEPESFTVYVTSTLVAQAAAARGRNDVVSPDTGNTAKRDSAGHIVSVARLQCF